MYRLFGHTEKQNLTIKPNTIMTRKLASLLTLGFLIFGSAIGFTGCSSPDFPDSNLGHQLGMLNIKADTDSYLIAPTTPSKADSIAQPAR